MACWEKAMKLDPAIMAAFTIPGDEAEAPAPVRVPAHRVSHRGGTDTLRRFLEEDPKSG
jgi:hypothetical protein